MKYNTTISHGTKFLNPTQVIEKGLEKHHIANENWPCPAAFDVAVQQRETWYGRDARPTSIEGRI